MRSIKFPIIVSVIIAVPICVLLTLSLGLLCCIVV